jgi:ABC transport system ATP-binding/permease protein
MNETTLNALINLFALFSAKSRISRERAQSVFNAYLQLHLGISYAEDYKRLFDELIELYGIDGDPVFPVDINKQAANIANNIKSRIPRNEQHMLFLRFLELSRAGEASVADDLFDILAQVFNIPESELLKYKEFVFAESADKLKSPDFLVIDSQIDHLDKQVKRIFRKNIAGELVFLFLRQTGSYIFIFRGSENIYLEGNVIMPDRFYAFKEGGILRGPRFEPVYYADVVACFVDKEQVSGFELRGENIDFRFSNSENGLYDFSFRERSGQLIAVMGGSGVGKSTLLNILNGNITPDSGRVLINQIDIHNDIDAAKGLIGFVPQDDLLFEELTVWENLYYNARLCFDGFSDEQVKERVSKVLHELELFEFKDLEVGSPLKKIISGGQRKRLNVAMELIREPAILYVDEPTSGLSSMDSEKMMLLLRQQARKGKIIVVNIHQPSSSVFKLFDKLWILDKGGRPIYTGNPIDAIIYFKHAIGHVNPDECECLACGNVNPEQVLEIIETRKIDESGNFLPVRQLSPVDWYGLFKEKIEYRGTHEPIEAQKNPGSEFSIPSRYDQFVIFFQRNLRVKVSDKQYLLINLIEAPLLALIVGYFTRFAEADQYLFFENKNLISYFFMAIVVVLFIGMSVSAEEIIRDRKILQREAFLNLSRFSYLNSKIVFLLSLSAFQTLTFVIVGNLVLGIHGMHLSYWMVLFSVAAFSNMLGLNISSAFDSVVTIYIIIPLMLIPQILLCGVIVKFDDLQNKMADKDGVPIVGELMVSRWAFEALAVEQYANNAYMANFFEIEKEIARSRFRAEILTTELIGRVEQASGFRRLQREEKEIASRLNIVRNEIEKLNREAVIPPFKAVDYLKPHNFTDAIADSVQSYLYAVQDYHIARQRQLRAQKDRVVALIEGHEGRGALHVRKMKYHNSALEDLVLNSTSNDFFRITENGIMQKVAPIYKAPDFKYGRAHFLSSEKHFGSIYIKTIYFNLIVIWMMTLFLYLVLYFDWLRKLVNYKFRSSLKKLFPK